MRLLIPMYASALKTNRIDLILNNFLNSMLLLCVHTDRPLPRCMKSHNLL